MSDILTNYSSYGFDNDNLVEFLTKLARFGIDQCLHFAHLIDHKQRLYQDRQNDLSELLMEIRILQNEFYNILLIISSSDDETKQLLFLKLQNCLTNFVEINLRFKTFDSSSKENSKQLTNALDLPTEKSDENISPTSSFTTIPQIIIQSPSFYSTDDINNNNMDIGKCWKFANIIHTRFEASLIASDSHTIICYNNQNKFLHTILITGHFQGNIKWKYNSIIDILWCTLIDRYIAITDTSLYTIQYDRSTSSQLIINKILDFEKFHSARIACNENNILLYTIHQKSSSIQVYNKQFKQEKIFHSSTNKQLPINSPSFCCTNTLIGLTEKEEVLISYFPYVTPKKISLLLFDINTCELCYTIDLNNCSNIYTMKCLQQQNIFFALSDEKILWFIQIDKNETVQIAQKTFYTNQTEMCIINNRDLLLINVNAGHAIQLVKYRKIKQ